ncbi:MAG: glycosyltransferase family 4 protein [Planctomycetota bacterium]|nr:glycosyltransferase family 4 protein [Planctomycetota bacterium]
MISTSRNLLHGTALDGLRVLYVLNSAGGGATQGIYEHVRSGHTNGIVPFAVIPPSRANHDRLTHVFAGVRSLPLPWWDRDIDAGFLRKAAVTYGRLRRKETLSVSRRKLRELCREWGIDAIHSGTAVTLSGALVAHELGIPHIWHVKECIGRTGRVQFPLTDGPLVSLFEGLSHRVVVMSKFIGRPFFQHGCNNVEVIPDGVDGEIFQPTGSRHMRDALQIGDGVTLAGMVASLTSNWKRHDVFIEVAAEVCRRRRDVHFLLVGPQPKGKRWPHDRPSHYYARIRALAESRIPADRLHFQDFTDDAADLMRSLDVLVHTCDVEPFGRIAIESMACGIPVVGPSTGGIAETVVSGSTGLLVDPHSPAEYASAIERIADDDTYRRQLADQAVRHVRDHFTIEQYASRIEAVYRSAGKSSRGRIETRTHQDVGA